MASWVGPAIVAAVISGLVTAFGWFVAQRQEFRREALRRQDTIRDVQTAIVAEIRANEHRLAGLDLDAYAADIAQQILTSSGAGFTPFIPREAPTFVFDALIGDIQILPTDVIDSVVVYYRQVHVVAQFIEDMRSDRFDRLEPRRKLAIYRDYIDLLRYARTLARNALQALDMSLTVSSSA